MADGKVVISTELDNSDIPKGVREISGDLGGLKKVTQKMESEITAAFSSASDLAEKFGDDVSSYYELIAKSSAKSGSAFFASVAELFGQDPAGEASESALAHTNDLKAALESAQKTVDDLEEKGFWWGDEEYEKAFAALDRIKKDIAEAQTYATSAPPVENPFGLDTIAGKIREAELQLSKLSESGKGLGTEEYDEAYKALSKLNQEAKEYRKSLTDTTVAPGLDTYEGKILALEAELRQLHNAGKALGDPAYDEVYHKLALMKAEAREYAAELAKTPEQIQREAEALAAKEAKEAERLAEIQQKEEAAAAEAIRLREIGNSAEVSSQQVIQLRAELEQLTARQADLKAAGIGLGIAEFDRNAQRIAEINQQLREYEASLTSVKDETAAVARETGSMKSAVGSLNNSVGKGFKTILKYAFGIRSLYFLFNKVRAAVKEGFENLVQYDSDANKSVSALSSSLTQMKNSLATAFAPILNAAAPALTTLINLLSKATTSVGMFFAAITGQKTFTKAVAVQEDYAASLESTGSAAKTASKSLAGFDEITKLTSNDSDSGTSVPDMFEEVEVPTAFTDLTEKIKGMFGPILQDFQTFGDRIAESTKTWFAGLDFGPLKASLSELLASIEPLVDIILDGLAWAYENILLPLGKWTIEEAAPALVSALASAFDLLSAILGPVIAGLENLFTALQPVFSFIGNTVIHGLEKWKELFDDLAKVYEEKGPEIEEIMRDIGEVFSVVWSVIEPILAELMRVWGDVFSYLSEATANSIGLVIDILHGYAEYVAGVLAGDWERAFNGLAQIVEGFGEATEKQFSLIEKSILAPFDAFLKNVFARDWTQQFGIFGNVLNAFSVNVKNTCESIKTNFGGVATFISGAFSGDWKKAWSWVVQIFSGLWSGLKSAAKSPINGIIGFINGLIQAVTIGINAIINAVNKLSFTVPGWVPGLGGSKLGFHLSSVSCPQIPYLAQGAVLPANKPFLAMVGDQRSGTNVEAPLATIQEAVANVLDDQLTAMMAGFEAVVQAIREKDSSVVIGDDVIYGAAQRQQAKLALARGGGL